MGYRIVYNQDPVKKYRFLPLQNWIAMFLFLLALVVRITWPSGAQMLREIFVPKELSREAEAVVAMVQQLQLGDSISDAVEVFCQEIFGE